MNRNIKELRLRTLMGRHGMGTWEGRCMRSMKDGVHLREGGR